GDTFNFAEWKREKLTIKDLVEIRNNTSRVKCQFEHVHRLKERLPTTHSICQMYFAYNYSCGHAEEIKTAYFDTCSVTLHPVVL
ncbi:hypothetical protein MAR_025064, partial [Mya arenaria]